MREADDRTLLKQFYRDGNDDALAAFVDRHRGWAVAKARGYYAEEAEDVVQTSILRLMDSTPTNGEVTNPLGWWSVIISTAAMDALRRTMRRRRREQESFRFREPDGEPAVIDVAETVARTRLLDTVAAEIDALEDHSPTLRTFPGAHSVARKERRRRRRRSWRRRGWHTTRMWSSCRRRPAVCP